MVSPNGKHLKNLILEPFSKTHLEKMQNVCIQGSLEPSTVCVFVHTQPLGSQMQADPQTTEIYSQSAPLATYFGIEIGANDLQEFL